MPELSRRTIPRWLFIPGATYLVARFTTLLVLGIVDAIGGESLHGQLMRWDTKWYLKAAVNGWPRHLIYVHGHVPSSTLAFFPTLPLAMRWSAHLTGLSAFQTGLIISFVTGLSATLAVSLLV